MSACKCKLDPVALSLKAQGFELRQKRITDQPDALFLGYSFEYKSSELAFLVDPTETITISFYGRTAARVGLKNAFTAFVDFLDFLWTNSQRFGINRVRGAVDPDPGFLNNITQDRLRQFFQKHIGASLIKTELGQIWLQLELRDYQPHTVRPFLSHDG